MSPAEADATELDDAMMAVGFAKSISGVPTSSPPRLPERNPRTNRRILIDPIPTVLSQVPHAPYFLKVHGVRFKNHIAPGTELIADIT
jgi:3-hydroxymyristoyl/3-hydroxydecanoyl-(acyl carrier protein) dehydratase